MLGGEPRIEVANESPYRVGEQSTFLVRLLRARAGLVHFPHYNLPLAFPGRSVVTIHDLFSYRFPEIHSGWFPRRVNRLLISNAVRRASAIITPSRATAADVASRFPHASGRIVPIAEAADGRFEAIRNSLGEAAWQRYFGVRPPYFLYLGQWKAYKNVPLVIEAFRRIAAQRPNVQLVIAGHDPRHPEVVAAVSRLPQGSAVLPGHLPDDAVADLYRGAAAVVMPAPSQPGWSLRWTPRLRMRGSGAGSSAQASTVGGRLPSKRFGFTSECWPTGPARARRRTDAPPALRWPPARRAAGSPCASVPAR